MFRDSSSLGRFVHGLAKWLAVAGGLVLIAMIVLIVVSIVGRALIWAGLKPVPGDYELVTIGMGFAVFAFLPWTHLERGHALVSLVTDRFSVRANSHILAITDLMMLFAASFIAWRLYAGMIDKFGYRETTILLGFPLGWAYLLGFIGAAVGVVVALYVFCRSVAYILRDEAEPRRAGGEV